MSDIQIRQKQDDGLYHKLYVKTTAVQSLLSDTTSNLFGGVNKSAEDGLQTIINNINKKRVVIIKCIDKNGEPLSGIVASGINGNPSTNSKGLVGGVLTDYSSATVTLNPKQIDIKSVSVDMTDYIGRIKPKVVQMDTVEEGHIARFTSSTTVQFSNAVKTIDVCCVGGGGGGDVNPSQDVGSGAYAGGGGGGGGEVNNSFSVAITPNTQYNIAIGAGGDGGSFGLNDIHYSAKDGGDTEAFGLHVSGGRHATGSSGGHSLGGGNGGYGKNYQSSGENGGNSTATEFNDGTTKYSGGGGGGGGKSPVGTSISSGGSGGSPYGGAGAGGNSSAPQSGRGYGGGGGGSYGSSSKSTVPSAGSGHSGLVAIRLHF